jgi:RNA recognition motif-containing protein
MATSVANLSVAEKLEMSLDDLTKLRKAEAKKKRQEEQKKKKVEQAKKQEGKGSTPKKGKGDNGGKGDKVRSGEKPKSSDKKPKKPTSAPASEKPPLVTGTPVIVSNVDDKVDAAELKDIFEAVGPVKTIEILPAKGKQPTAARVTFKVKADAEKAVAEFNERLLDGKKISVKLTKKRIILSDKPKGSRESNGSQQQNKRQKKSE